MEIEKNLFASYKVILDQLKPYGFDAFDDVYGYSVSFHQGEFAALITIDEHGHLSGKVIEKAFGEEYAPLKSDAFYGGFVGEIREEYKAILLDIRDKCFKKRLFISDQANRIAALIKQRYGEEPDHPFKDSTYESYGVFRYAGNAKWYGILMNIPYEKIGGPKGENVDVLNVRIDEAKREDILKDKAIIPAYHMNKKKWVSLILDETLSDEEVMSFIDDSRNFMMKK